MIRSLTIEYRDDVLLTLGMSAEQFAEEAKTLVAMKLYEMGRLSSGAAAEFAGMPKPLFLTKLADYGIDSFNLTRTISTRIWPMPGVIADTSPLQYLHQTELLDLLPTLLDGLTCRMPWWLARAVGLDVVGTLGVLLRAKETGALEALRPVLVTRPGPTIWPAGMFSRRFVDRQAINVFLDNTESTTCGRFL